MDCEAYIKQCASAWRANPPHHATDGADDPERLLWMVRYFARVDGAGLAGYPTDEVKQHLYLLWDAYIKAFLGTKYMKLMGDNFSNKKLFAWVLEAKAEAEAAGWDCRKANAAEHHMQRTVGDSPTPQALPQPEILSTAEADTVPAQLPLM
jgi:hypothetical protein